MDNTNKQKLGLCFTINDFLSSCSNEDHISPEMWDDMREALTTYSLPAENIMFELINKMKQAPDEKILSELIKYFTKFFDAQCTACADSLKISRCYTEKYFGCDREFNDYITLLQGCTHKELEEFVFENLVILKNNMPDFYNLLTVGTSAAGTYFEDNKLDGINGESNSLITNRVAVLKDNVFDLIWLYNNLADSVSRISLNAVIKFWLTWDYNDWKKIANYYIDVCSTDIYTFYDDEVFVDCGSYIGDTVLQYTCTINDSFKRVYAYDISRGSIEEMKKNLSHLNNVEIRHKGTSDINSTLDMFGSSEAFMGNTLNEQNAFNPEPVDTVEVVRLDSDIKEPVTFIKIDCEGMDKETLLGASGLVKKYHPKLHVDSYHKVADIINVPKLIREIDNSYALYLRLPDWFAINLCFPIISYMAI